MTSNVARSNREGWRIIGAVAGKDLLDAFKNRTLLGIVVGMLLVVLTSQALPLLLVLRAEQTVFVYDGGAAPTVAEALALGDGFSVHTPQSAEVTRAAVGESASAVLGLIVPAGTALTGDPIRLEGVIPYWVAPAARAEIVQGIEAALAERLGAPVEVHVEPVYPAADGSGRHYMASLLLFTVLMLTGMLMTPYLLVDEKETHTLDALLVSPARVGQIVVGKGLVGLAYCAIAAAVVLTFNAAIVTNWGLLALGIAAGALLFVGLGLLLGSLFSNMTALNMAASGVALVLLIPALVAGLPGARLSPWMVALLRWVPSVAFIRVARTAMSGSVATPGTWANLAGVAAAAVVATLAAVRLMGRNRR